MTWTPEKIELLKTLCYQDIPNKDIAAELGCPVTDVYAKRSQLGITIDKVSGRTKPTATCQHTKKCSKLLKLLTPALRFANPDISRLELCGNGAAVIIVHGNGVGTRVSIEGDSLSAVILDVTRKCMF